jgi:nucleoid-associated protein YgaU
MTDGRKTQLTITRVEVSPDGSIRIDRTKTFTAMLNPSDVEHKRAIRYNTKMTLGQVGTDAKFSGVAPDTVKFSLLLDGTGAVPAGAGAPTEVADQVTALNNVVYKYDGEEHQPDHVRLLWGTLILYGRMQSMSVNYTLFKPSGDPLRAKVSLEFVGFMSTKEAELAANRSSPDLTHLVEVREGDTLPLLCVRIYGDPGYFLDVARFNGLDGFRRLEPGARLQFPPLE